MYLRKLETKDSTSMLEWMHDCSVVKDLQIDFLSKTIEDCKRFIKNSREDSRNLHLAVADEDDSYQGTVSLKNIDGETAEFAIVIHPSAIGQGIANKAMEKLIEFGFEEKGLKSIYWCVSPRNIRAVKFYDKNGYHRVSPDALSIRRVYSEEQIREYYWYLITREERRNRVSE